MTFDEMVARASPLARPGGRRLLGLTGPPAAGKTTLANQLAAAFGERAIVVGMDGFHLAQHELVRLGSAGRKGAPDTFDAHGYVRLLGRLVEPGVGETVYAPEFRREIEEPVAGAIAVPPEIPLVITEGNYLLLDESPWSRVRTLLDEVWFLAPPESDRIDRLVARHRRYGRSEPAARSRAEGSDQRNADLIAPTAARADLVVGPGEPADYGAGMSK